MKEKNTLILFYSRSGITAKVAHALQRETGGELVEIKTKSYAPGYVGFLTAALDATLGRAAPIEVPDLAASAYDTILLGSPVWGASVSAPMRTFLARPLPRTKKIGFFLTHGGSGADRVFQQMEELCGQRPSGTLAITEAETKHRSYLDKVRGFARSLGGRSRAKAA